MIFSAIFRAPNYAKCGIWQAYLGEPNMVQRGISISCRWFWQQLFFGRTRALSESRKMTTFSRRSVELGYVKLYPNSILRVSSKQFWQPQAWHPPPSELSAGGVKRDIEKTLKCHLNFSKALRSNLGYVTFPYRKLYFLDNKQEFSGIKLAEY